MTATTISSTWANNTLSDIATGLSTCVLKDGSQTITGNIPMSTFKITGLGLGTVGTDAASLTNIVNVSGALLTSVSGTDTITAGALATFTYVSGQKLTLIPAGANTGATTLNVTPSGGSAQGAKNVFANGVACVGGELQSGVPAIVEYDGTQFNILGLCAATGSTASTFTFNGSGGSSGSLTMTWQKIGKFITINIPSALATTGTGSTALTSDTALPTGIRPATQQLFACNSIQNNAAATADVGVIAINTNGTIQIVRNHTVTAFTNSATGGMDSSTTLTYSLL